MTGKPDWTGRRLEVEVGPVAHGGHCVARYEGRVVFVRHALPGEVVIAEVTEDKGGGFCRADAVEVRQAAPGRVTPPCPLADIALGTDRCGGCDFQHVDGETQRELKSAVVTEQLQRIAGLDWPVQVRELPGGLLRWRTRARLAVDRKGNAGFRPSRSHRVIPVADCPITVEGAVPEVADRRWRPGAELTVTADGEGELHVTALDKKPQRRGHQQAVARQVAGSGVAHETVRGLPFEVSAQGFWQVHRAAPETFTEVVARLAAVPSRGVAWDLYGGVGLFAADLAEQVGPTGSVLLVESSRRAVEDAVANLRDLPQVGFRAGTVERVLADEDVPAPDVVVLDPPRKGAGREVVEAITAREPSRVVHVACDPAALARDVSLFAENGYRLVELEAYDAFPMTHHVECIALLEREG
ncbi:class I SAM-dependent RNA methyltransferase [Saccharopolyspora rhizosphaerae]|uniref:Class I SAM-dependent RNA methyltransferase n=1 Tax=Saccharopolyspora rhizosphaerae TaxID=2492662 RepID=A0A426JNJ9_9PSEU|nr:TRAM domain-containing protein [Saccharopolyspora rhizosphaerae]RRO14813.1 class I SAM-dependent RNA methyltransferase [Saccharopolyspora rhizosphaerae]